MNKFIKYLFTAAVLPMFLTSCDLTKDPDVGGTAVEQLSGDFLVQILLDGEAFDDNYWHLHVYNTAANVPDNLWIDASDVWPFKIKANCNASDLSFTFTPLTENPIFEENYGVPDSISILSGRVLKGAATTPAGNKTDSIFINFVSTGVEFFDLPRGTYTMTGFRQTGFLEDEL